MLITKPKPKLLCVDDEPEILAGFKQNLRRSYKVYTAESGPAGLEILEADGPFAIVMSDMRMPEMDGAEFLTQAKKISPESVRILLTGQTDIESAISAINSGQIFRFLTKPCQTSDLLEVLDVANEQYRLVVSEKELLSNTLKGSIKTLTDALAITSPLAFGRAKRVHKMVALVCTQLEISESWSVEIAALLSRLGSISVPENILQKYFQGSELKENEQARINAIPKLTKKLLGNIPRMEKIIELIDMPNDKDYSVDDDVSISSEILRVADDVDDLVSGGVTADIAIATLIGREGKYNVKVTSAFEAVIGTHTKKQNIREIKADQLKEGMILIENLHTATGALLVGHGYEVTESFVFRVKSFKPGFIKEPLKVALPDNDESNESEAE